MSVRSRREQLAESPGIQRDPSPKRRKIELAPPGLVTQALQDDIFTAEPAFRPDLYVQNS